MNKITLTILSASILSASVFATCTKDTCKEPVDMNWTKTSYTITSKDTAGKDYYLDVDNIQKFVSVGIADEKVGKTNVGALSAGIGMSATVNKNIYTGANLDVEATHNQNKQVFGATAEVKGGYVVNNRLATYAILGVKDVFHDSDVKGVGLGIGVGLDYRVCSKSIVEVDFKNYDMKVEKNGPDYQNNSVGIKFKYLF